MSEDFDRSFDFFLKNDHEGSKADTADSWNKSLLDQTLNVMSTSNNNLEYPVSKTSDSNNKQQQQQQHQSQQSSPTRNGNDNRKSNFISSFFSSNPIANNNNNNNSSEEDSTIHVVVHEQISAMYDDFSQEGAISVTGTVHVKGSTTFVQQQKPFCIVLKEVSMNVQKLEITEQQQESSSSTSPSASSLCEDVSQEAHDRDSLYPSDRAIRILLNPTNVTDTGEAIVATYSCVTKLRPVPLLLKCRVRTSNEFARVGFKIRANPTNECSINNIVIMMAVPPDVDGENVKTSCKDGSWDEIKRTLCWTIDQVEPGKALEIQAQFAFLRDNDTAIGTSNNSTNMNRIPKFPVVVRCDYPALFSTISISNEYHDPESVPVNINVNTSTRILHRKV